MNSCISFRLLALAAVVPIIAGVLALSVGGAEAKVQAPEYLVVLFEDGAVEWSGPQLESWLESATPVHLDGPAARPNDAVDAVSFWSQGWKSFEARVEFARSDLGQRSAGWWAPDGSGGGTLVLRGDFRGGVSPLGPSQEQAFRSDSILPQASVSAPVSTAGGSFGRTDAVLGAVGAGVVLLSLAAALWFAMRARSPRKGNAI